MMLEFKAFGVRISRVLSQPGLALNPCPGADIRYLRLLVPKSVKGMALGTADLKYGVSGPCGL